VSTGLKGARVLVLGASGFIGQHLCCALVKRGAAVRGFSLDRPSSGGVLKGTENEIEWIQGEIGDEALVRSSIQGIDIVYHLVCTTLPASSNGDLRQDLASNVLPTLSMVEAIRCSDVKKLVFASSGGTVYGVPENVPVPETHANNPICGYGIHKLAIEKYLHLYNYHFGLDYGVLRVSNPYGIGQVSDRAQGAIGSFLYRAMNHRPVEIWGNGLVIRDYIYIDDVIEAFLSIAKHDGRSRVFNIGSGKGRSLLDIVSTIEQVIRRKLTVNHRPARSVDVPVNILDISLATTELGWRPVMELEAGIRRVWEHQVRDESQV
jgi:UDP-glucose 4-epimerase